MRLILAAMLVATTLSVPSERRRVDPAIRAASIPRRVAVASAETLAVFVDQPPTPHGGDAPATVVILPGPIGSAFSMRHITAALHERGITTVVIDLLGMGVAARPANADYSLTQQARRVESVLDTMRLQRIVLLAQGTSATVAYHVAADQPSRVQSIVSLAGGAIDRQGTHGVKLALALAPLLDTPLGRALGRRKFLASVREQSANAEWCTKDVMREYLSPYETDLRRSLRALGRMADAREPVPIAARLPLVRTPVHLLLGAKQSANAPSATEVEQLRRLLPSLTVDTIERAGTMLHEERADAVVAAVIKSVRLVNP